SRSLRLRLSDGSPLVVVATDGGLMPVAQPGAEYRQGGAERYEVLIDFSKYPVGRTVDLTNLSNKNNIDYDNTNKVMRFQVVDDSALPPDGADSRSISSMPSTLVASDAMGLTEKMSTGGLSLRLERSD